MATGNKPVPDSFNDRFDIYNGNGPSANFTPSINVRKGYALASGNNYCSANFKAGDSLTAPQAAAGRAVSLAPVPANGGTMTVTVTKTSATATMASTSGIVAGMSIVTAAGL